MKRPFFLSSQKAKRVHAATLEVLEKTGVQLDHAEAESLYLEAGATKDKEGRILIPQHLVEEALEKAPAEIQMYDRDGESSVLVRDGKTYFGPGSDALYNIDRKSGERRYSRVSDVTNNVRLVDGLKGFDFMMSMALPQDVEQHRLYPAVFAEMVKNTNKPIVTTLTTVEDIKSIHRIASIVAGGAAQLKERPFFLAYLEPISPLKMDNSGTQRLLYCAENEIPFMFAAGANSGTGAPITPEGGVVQGTAESLAGLILAMLKNEAARFVYGANTSSVDMKSMLVCYGAPEWYKTVAMYADMGKYYKLPSWGTAGCSDAFFVDAQAAMEAYEGIVFALQSGSTLVHDVGYLAHGELYDTRMLVLTDAMIGRAKHILKAVDLSEANLAVDVINEVARHDDLYLAQPHTAERFRESLWMPPTFIERRKTEERENASELTDLLSEAVDRVSTNHKPKALADGKAEQIDQLLNSI
ncbi:MAG: trimethylamine methyltransferase family protein [Desulfobacterales bacterium]|jgi:trimethylamine--corrinoid protein Co-methyltransferase